MADRQCESCGGKVPHRMSRTRNEQGLMVCEECIKMTNPTGPGWVTAMAGLPQEARDEVRRRSVEALVAVKRVLQRTAHDSGDNAIINHCPFCGSGAVVGGSSGNVSCEFCHTNFTVQVQPSHSFMPQTIDGQPVAPAGMPGDMPTEMSAPLDPAIDETEEGVVEEASGVGQQGPDVPPAPEEAKGKVPPQFAKGASFRTATGATLDADAYMARLALEYADDRNIVLDAVRHENAKRVEAASTVTCPSCRVDPQTDCPLCHGTGLYEVKIPGVTADLLNPDTRIDDNSLDLLAEHDVPFDGDLLADNAHPIPDHYHRPSAEWLDMMQWRG